MFIIFTVISCTVISSNDSPKDVYKQEEHLFSHSSNQLSSSQFHLALAPGSNQWVVGEVKPKCRSLDWRMQREALNRPIVLQVWDQGIKENMIIMISARNHLKILDCGLKPFDFAVIMADRYGQMVYLIVWDKPHLILIHKILMCDYVTI